MYDLRCAISATLFVLAVSSSASAADRESLSNQETKGPELASQCLEDLRAFDQKLSEVGFGVLPPGGYGVSAPSSYSGYTTYGTEGCPYPKPIPNSSGSGRPQREMTFTMPVEVGEGVSGLSNTSEDT